MKSSDRMKGKPRLKKGGIARDPVGQPRFHAVYNGKSDAPVQVGPASRTSVPKIPKPCCGAGRGFRGI